MGFGLDNATSLRKKLRKGEQIRMREREKEESLERD